MPNSICGIRKHDGSYVSCQKTAATHKPIKPLRARYLNAILPLAHSQDTDNVTRAIYKPAHCSVNMHNAIHQEIHLTT